MTIMLDFDNICNQLPECGLDDGCQCLSPYSKHGSSFCMCCESLVRLSEVLSHSSESPFPNSSVFTGPAHVFFKSGLSSQYAGVGLTCQEPTQFRDMSVRRVKLH